jgi:hypothetical protein
MASAVRVGRQAARWPEVIVVTIILGTPMRSCALIEYLRSVTTIKWTSLPLNHGEFRAAGKVVLQRQSLVAVAR